MEEYLRIGVITSPHGVKGEVKVYPTTDGPERFEQLQCVFFSDGSKRDVLGAKIIKNMAVLRLSGILSRNDAESLRNQELFVSREMAIPLEKDEYYIADLIGLSVYDEEENLLGVLKDVLQTGANDVYVVSGEAYGEILIPAIKQCILKTDIRSGRMRVHLLPGLID